MEDEMYCTQCGAKISPGAKFCPECGKYVEEMEQDQPVVSGGTYYANQQYKTINERSRLQFYGTLAIVYAILAIISGISCIATADMLADAIIEQDIDIGMDVEEFRDTMVLLGVTSLLSGMCALVGGFLVHGAKQFKLSMVLYIAATVLAFESIIPLVLGVIFTYLVYKCRDAFES
ncbi:hypothetical protein TALC_00415 [Thermoplasmatales archaeon BRNA1]|nr:hypothetical protein TALC_00415 [Thermoplasmatales archaeon BRNA1]